MASGDTAMREGCLRRDPRAYVHARIVWTIGCARYMTLRMMTLRPDVFTVGSAGAPVTHWDG